MACADRRRNRSGVMRPHASGIAGRLCGAGVPQVGAGRRLYINNLRFSEGEAAGPLRRRSLVPNGFGGYCWGYDPWVYQSEELNASKHLGRLAPLGRLAVRPAALVGRSSSLESAGRRPARLAGYGDSRRVSARTIHPYRRMTTRHGLFNKARVATRPVDRARVATGPLTGARPGYRAALTLTRRPDPVVGVRLPTP